MALAIRYRETNLAFEYPFRISGGRIKSTQPALIVEISKNGLSGYGEAPAISYYHIPVSQMIADLERIRPQIEACNAENPEIFYALLEQIIPENSFLRCALDMAFWDLTGKILQQPIFKLWNTTWRSNLPLTDYTLGIDEPQTLLDKIQQHPWPVYKLKVGEPNDLERLSFLREHCTAIFRTDTNAGWTLEEAVCMLPHLKKLGIELIEQPLAVNDTEGMTTLFSKCDIPLFADESCVSESDVALCHGMFHGINIKLTKCGGMTPALRMIGQARKLGLLVMMGSMNESSIGSAAIAQFLPQLDYVDMDGPLLLKEDLAEGLHIVQGKIQLSNLPGLGVSLKPGLF